MFVIVCPTAISAVRLVRFETSREIFDTICERPSFATLKNSRRPFARVRARVSLFFLTDRFQQWAHNSAVAQ